jgi:hypothetical protein
MPTLSMACDAEMYLINSDVDIREAYAEDGKEARFSEGIRPAWRVDLSL